MRRDNDNDRTSPSVEVSAIHRISPVAARELVDARLGRANTWPSPLISYRLDAEWQADWKVEVGQWLKAADDCGFLAQVLHQLERQARRPTAKFTQKDPNDDRHLKLHQHLAPAFLAHYLTALAWTFDAYEPETGREVDVDISLRTPDNGRNQGSCRVNCHAASRSVLAGA